MSRILIIAYMDSIVGMFDHCLEHQLNQFMTTKAHGTNHRDVTSLTIPDAI